jgi:hypothetical protein
MTGMWHPCEYEEYELDGHPEVGRVVCGVITPLHPGMLPLARLHWLELGAEPGEAALAHEMVRLLAFQAWEGVP